MPYANRLLVQDLIARVRLGCTEEEKLTPQEVRVSLELQFSRAPMACESDHLKDTVCYADLALVVTETCQSQKFNTVEHLAFRCFGQLRKTVDPQIKINVTVHKVCPPIPGLKGGVIFNYGDCV